MLLSLPFASIYVARDLYSVVCYILAAPLKKIKPQNEQNCPLCGISHAQSE